MDEKQKIDVAVFRYGVIHDFVNGIELEHGQKEIIVQEKCARKWNIPFSQKSSISKGTIQRWIRIYKASGCKLESLHPKGRSDNGRPRAMHEETRQILKQLKEEMPDETVPFILKIMAKRGIPLCTKEASRLGRGA